MYIRDDQNREIDSGERNMRVYVGTEKRRSRETQGVNLAMQWRLAKYGA